MPDLQEEIKIIAAKNGTENQFINEILTALESNTEVKKQLVNILKADLKTELTETVKADLKTELTETVKADLKTELTETVKDGLEAKKQKVKQLETGLEAEKLKVKQLEGKNKELEAKNKTMEHPKQNNAARYTAGIGVGLTAGLVAFTALERTVRLDIWVMAGIAVASALVAGGITYAVLPSTQVNGAKAQEVNENGQKK